MKSYSLLSIQPAPLLLRVTEWQMSLGDMDCRLLRVLYHGHGSAVLFCHGNSGRCHHYSCWARNAPGLLRPVRAQLPCNKRLVAVERHCISYQVQKPIFFAMCLKKSVPDQSVGRMHVCHACCPSKYVRTTQSISKTAHDCACAGT